MKYAWIAKHKTHLPVTSACGVLGVSTSGFFEHWRRKDAERPSRPEAKKRISDEALLVHINAIHAEVKQEYGWPKMWKELVDRGIRVSKERVRKLMQRHGIKAVDWIDRGLVDLSHIITHKVDFHDVANVFYIAERTPRESCKVLLDFGGDRVVATDLQGERH